jgi:hypothetical protein
MARYVGLDVHMRVVEACILDEAGNVVLRHRFDPGGGGLEHFARTRLLPDDRVAVEATTSTWAVIRALKPFVAEAVVANPMLTGAIARRRSRPTRSTPVSWPSSSAATSCRVCGSRTRRLRRYAG